MLRPITMLTAAVTVFGCATGGAVAAAETGSHPEWGLNGTYIATSNGEWARKNEVFYEQASVRSTWTISTECSYPGECTGTVHSDWGWTAPIYTTTGLWYVKRVLPEWRYCADGRPVEGLRTYKIYPVGFDGRYQEGSDEFTGENATIGASGSCGRNQWPHIRMPFYMRKISD